MNDLFSYGPRNVREFLKQNHRAILYTIIVHLVVAIILLLLKVEGLKEDRELGVMLDFTEEETLEDKLDKENIEVPQEWLDKVYEAREKASNQAVNLDDRVEEEISTRNYVNELLDELESQKDPEFLRNREKWEEIISSYVYEEPPAADTDELLLDDDTPFTGPTTITYEFLGPPKDRRSRKLVIPVYRCEGAARLVIDIEVRPDGSVSTANVVSIDTQADPECFIDAAKSAAMASRFFSNSDAPQKHVARVTYQFIPQ